VDTDAELRQIVRDLAKGIDFLWTDIDGQVRPRCADCCRWEGEAHAADCIVTRAIAVVARMEAEA